jgi:hypothetical protein
VNLTLDRIASNKDATLGLLRGHCFILEDQHQETKVYGETRIPAGLYEIKLRNAGGMNAKFHTKYPNHKGMLHLQDVPGFEWVYIHPGNTDDDTLGCLLPGYGATLPNSVNRGNVSSSRDAYLDLYDKIVRVIETEQVFIYIRDLSW